MAGGGGQSDPYNRFGLNVNGISIWTGRVLGWGLCCGCCGGCAMFALWSSSLGYVRTVAGTRLTRVRINRERGGTIYMVRKITGLF